MPKIRYVVYNIKTWEVVSKEYDTPEDAYKCLLKEHKKVINVCLILEYWSGK